MSLPFAAGIITILIISFGVFYSRLQRREEKVEKLEKLLEDANRELASFELLKSHFLSRIGDVLASPLKTIETSSNRLSSLDSGIPEEIQADLNDLSAEVRSLIRIMSVLEDISNSSDADGQESDNHTEMEMEMEIVHMDDIVSEAAMEISDAAADKQVSLSVGICGRVDIPGKKAQLVETVSSIFREALKRAAPGTVLSVELRIEKNMQLETGWSGDTSSLPQAEEDILGAGFVRLVASAHKGWLSVNMENESITLILPVAGEGS